MKNVRIWSYFGPYFPAFRLNTDQNNSEYGHFLRSVNQKITRLVSLDPVTNKCNMTVAVLTYWTKTERFYIAAINLSCRGSITVHAVHLYKKSCNYYTGKRSLVILFFITALF